MGTRVLKMDNQKYGGCHFETKDEHGNVVFAANGIIHEFVPEEKITRTFEMMNAPYGVTLEFLNLKSSATIRASSPCTWYTALMRLRDENLKLPFKQGVNWAHNELEKIAGKLK